MRIYSSAAACESSASNSAAAELMAVARPALWRTHAFGWRLGRTEGSADVFARLASAHSGPASLALTKQKRPPAGTQAVETLEL